MNILYLPGPYSQQRQRDVKAKIYPVLMAMEASLYANHGHRVDWGGTSITPLMIAGGFYDKIIEEPEGLPFLALPRPNRILTRAMDYQDNGNFMHLPGTYIQSARDCWYHKCSFCAWAKKYPECETRPVQAVLDEVQECADQGFRDIFDDSGTFPAGKWIKDFCKGMIERGLNKRVWISCNMRFGVLDLEDFELMKRANFRMILWGLESVNQYTLDRLNKGIHFTEVMCDLHFARCFGLWNHVAVMFGYPWEHYVDAQRTYDFIKAGLMNGQIQSAQASIYDVPEVSCHQSFNDDFRKGIYRTALNPRFVMRRIKGIKSWDELKYYFRALKKVVMK